MMKIIKNLGQGYFFQWFLLFKFILRWKSFGWWERKNRLKESRWTDKEIQPKSFSGNFVV